MYSNNGIAPSRAGVEEGVRLGNGSIRLLSKDRGQGMGGGVGEVSEQHRKCQKPV